MIVYLAGGINGLSDSEAKDWREFAKEHLKCDTLDPMRRDYRGKEAGNEAAIVQGDLEDIRASDVILASCGKPSWGTAMELYYAYTQGKRIYAIVPSAGFKPESVSPWLRFHATVLSTFELAIGAINVMAESDALRAKFVKSSEVPLHVQELIRG